jgi:DNA replication protein DnaC
MPTLPPLPNTIKFLTTRQSRLLDQAFPPRTRKCITCGDTKTFRWYGEGRDPETVTDYECPCTDQFILHRRLLYSGITETYQRLGWEDAIYVPDDAQDLALDYVENAEWNVSQGTSLLIWGNRGTGKTLMGILVAKMLIASGTDCYVSTFEALIDTFATGWQDEETREWFNARVRNAKVLMVDDVGRERNKGPGSVGESLLEGVLRHRVGRAMPTIITTNMSPDDLLSGYGGHSMSLISERSIRYHFDGVDRRDEIFQTRFATEQRMRITRPVMVD